MNHSVLAFFRSSMRFHRSNRRIVFIFLVAATMIFFIFRGRTGDKNNYAADFFVIKSRADWLESINSLYKIGINLSSNFQNDDQRTIFEMEPVLVSAFSDNHYHEAISLLNSIRKWFGNRRIVVLYDLGLSRYRIDYLKSSYSDVIVEIKKLKFELLPHGVRNLHECRWKSIVIGLELTNYSSVLWLDSSIVIKKSLKPIFDLFKACKASCPTYPWLMFSSARHNIKVATNPAVYKYFPLSEKLKNRTMYEAGIQLIHGTKEVKENLLIPWILCSLDDNCISPPNSKIHCTFGGDTYANYSNCHRFDQSIINILLARENKFQERYAALEYRDLFEVKKNDWMTAFLYYLFY